MNIRTYLMYKQAFASMQRPNISVPDDGGIVGRPVRPRFRGPFGPMGCDLPKTEEDIEAEQQQANQQRASLENSPGMLGNIARGAYKANDFINSMGSLRKY